MPHSNGHPATDEDEVRAIDDILGLLEEQQRVVRDKTESAEKAAAAAAAALRTVEEVRRKADAALEQAAAAVEAAAATQRRAEAVRKGVEAAEERAGQSLAAFDDATSQRIAEAKGAVEQGKETLSHLVEAQYDLEQTLGPDPAATVRQIQDLHSRSQAAVEVARRVDARSEHLEVRLASDETRTRRQTWIGGVLATVLLALALAALVRSSADPPPAPSQALVGVLNGSSVPGLAEQSADALEIAGLPIAVIGNAAASDAPSKVYYRDGFRDHALDLAASLGLDPATQLERVDAERVRDMAPSALPLHLDVVVVVGRDGL